MTKLTLTEQEELFAKDCKLINLRYEYTNYISTTLNIYTDVTKELKTSEFKGLDNYFKAQ